jgi:hypothetical protein
MMGRQRRRGRRARALAGGLLFAGVLGFSAVALAAPDDGQLGGPPGPGVDSSVCTDGKGVTGVSGTTYLYGGSFLVVASAEVECQDGAAAAGSMGGETSDLDSTRCGAGKVAVGIVGREGDRLDQLVLRCRADDLSGAITDGTTFAGSGGGPDGPYDCPAGRQLVGLDGSIVFDGGDRVQHVEIRCAPRPAPETTITKHPKKETTKDKAKFRFTADPDADPTFECKLDKRKFRNCTALRKKKYKKLDPGKHKFKVKATVRGVTDPKPDKFKWKVLEE